MAGCAGGLDCSIAGSDHTGSPCLDHQNVLAVCSGLLPRPASAAALPVASPAQISHCFAPHGVDEPGSSGAGLAAHPPAAGGDRRRRHTGAAVGFASRRCRVLQWTVRFRLLVSLLIFNTHPTPPAHSLAILLAHPPPPTLPPTLQALLAALGLRTPGLLPAAILPLALTAVLFAGPLLQLAADRRRWQPRLALPLPVLLRNLVVAPLVEEFVFRSCMLSYLLACGISPAAAVAFSPLLFAASHLHHLYDLTRFQGHSLHSALAAVAFQFSFTALFGWLAAWLFVRSRHLAGVALPHAFCNLMGPPLPPPRGTPGRSKILAAYGLGIAGFWLLLRPLSEPRLFANELLQAG